MKLKNVNLTTTMRCKLCGVLVPQYDYRPHMTVEEFKRTLQELFLLIDSVERLQITGGEPLIHNNLSEMLELCFEYNQRFNQLWLFTNCAIPFRKDVIKILASHKEQVFVHCSDYGVSPEISEKNIILLNNEKIPYRYLKYYGEDQYCDGWVDNGDFIPHNRSQKENEEIFSNCPHVNRGGSWYIRHGQMHWCGRSIRGTELNKIPLMEEDYFNLYDNTISLEDKKKKLDKLLNASFITACDYCNGNYGTSDIDKRYRAGEQIENQDK